MKTYCPNCKIGWYDELEKCHECKGPLVEPHVPPEVPQGSPAPLPTLTPQVTPQVEEAPKPKSKSHKKKVVPQEVVPGEDKS